MDITKVLAFDKKKNKQILVGNIIDGVFYKDVEPKHYFRIVDGYGIQYVSLLKLIELKIKKIVIRDISKNQWETKPQEWIDNGKAMDFGSGKQQFLSMKYMHKI
jgi:hypothetical protein